MTISFGKWSNGNNSKFYTTGRIYLIVGAGVFPESVKFINDQGNVDEASACRFQLSTQAEYAAQQALIQQWILKHNDNNPKTIV